MQKKLGNKIKPADIKKHKKECLAKSIVFQTNTLCLFLSLI